MTAVYAELRQLAARCMQAERRDHSIPTTALVHEAWLRLAGQRKTSDVERSRFLALAATAMRRALVDHARTRGRAKRGGDRHRVELADVAGPGAAPVDIVALDDCLDRLGAHEPRAARVVEMRFFGGLTTEEIADSLQVTTRTIERDWRYAQAWLRRELLGSAP